MRLRVQLAVAALAVAPLSIPVTAGTAGPAAAAPSTDRPIRYTSWDSTRRLNTGRGVGVQVSKGTVTIADTSQQRRRARTTYDAGSWTSRWTSPGFAFTELIPSWEATTPEGTLVEIKVRGRNSAGKRSSWDTLGRWASGDQSFRRTSQGAQTDDLARVATDTWIANDSLTSWQIRVVLLRRAGSTETPTLDAVGAMVSRIPASTGVSRSPQGVAGGITLPVPKFSQMTHDGDYPEYDGGGEAWCSPTSLAMVLGYYKALPSTDEYTWVKPNHTDRVVDHIARMTYDYRYQGTGNWPFNTAYAATRTKQAFVTRFSSLRDVERFIAAGIPVITSLTFRAGGLDGSPLIRGTNGHLMVVVGFTASGDVVVNDPAAARKRGVRRIYDRGQFESAWLKRGSTGGSGGVAYIVRDRAHPLPARQGATNW